MAALPLASAVAVEDVRLHAANGQKAVGSICSFRRVERYDLGKDDEVTGIMIFTAISYVFFCRRG